MSDFFSKLILFRPFNVYGPKMDPGHVIPDLLSKIKNDKESAIEFMKMKAKEINLNSND